MFWRLYPPFALLYALLLTLLGAALYFSIDPDQRLALVGFAILAGGVGLAALAAVTERIARRISVPLNDLMRAAERVGVGEDSRVLADDRDAVGSLGHAFNRMSALLADRIGRLEEDRQQLRAILSGMVEGVVALGPDQRVLYANDRACRLLEFPTHSPVGRRLVEVVRQRPLLDVVRRALDGTNPVREELSWNGSAARSLTVHAARLPGPPPRGAVLVIHDTSDLRRLERLREEFVANVSHELKTPLSVIKVHVETLLDGAIDDAQHRCRFLEQIADQADRLSALIHDLLSLGKIEAGTETFAFAEVSVGAVARACLDRHRARAEARRQTVVLEADPADVRVWADEEALDSILDNLVDNAVKYTPEGGRVTIGCRAEGDDAIVEVIDDGIGIPEQDLSRIFERFYRVDKARSRELGGTGLGLSIVKHLAGAMGGSVGARSEVGRGTTFTIRLPRAAQPARLPT